MGNIKKQIFGFLVVLCVASSLQGMFSSSLRMRQLAQKRLAQKQSAATKAGQKTSVNIGSQFSFNASPFAAVGQKRSYSGGATQPGQSSTFWTSFTSFFKPKLISAEEVESLIGIGDFNDAALERAKTQLGHAFNANNNNKSSIIKERQRFGSNAYYSLTVLDEVFHYLLMRFRNEKIDDGTDYGIWMPSDKAINYLKLIEYLVNIGAEINPENYEMYKKAYLEDLMAQYSALFYIEEKMGKSESVKKQIELFKIIFRMLEPILGRLIPGFIVDYDRAKHEANSIKYKNTARYKEKKDQEERERAWQKKRQEEERQREEERRQDEQRKQRARQGNPRTQWEEMFRRNEEYSEKQRQYERAQQKFDEERERRRQKESEEEIRQQEESQEKWRQWQQQQKAGSKEQQGRGAGSGAGEPLVTIDGLKATLEIPLNTPNDMTLRLVRKWIMENHPDKFPKEMRDERGKKYGAFMGKYDKVIEKLNDLVKQEKRAKQQAQQNQE